MKHTSINLSTPDDALVEAFSALESPRDVANLLEVQYAHLTFLLYRSVYQLRYIQFEIPKRRGGMRAIMAPNRSLRILQSKLAHVLQCIYKIKPSVHGFVPDRSIVTNAKYHCKSSYVFNVDLKDFFPSINFGRVRGMFMASPYRLPSAAATTLAHICCFENQLPQGAPTSPIVSNMICVRLDTHLQKLAKANKCRYSRYADDLTFSTTLSNFPSDIATCAAGEKAHVGDVLLQAIESNGFAVNPEKVRLQRWDSHQEVTGLTVNRRPNVQRRFVRQIRAMIHAWEVYGLERAAIEHWSLYQTAPHRGQTTPPASYLSVVRGKIAYLAMVRGSADPLVQKFWTKFNQLVISVNSESPTPPARATTVFDNVRQAMWVLECDEQCSQGTAFALKDYGLVTCEHVLCEHASEGYLKAFRPDATWEKHPITVISSHKTIDLAILKIDVIPGSNLEFHIEYGLNDHAKILVGGFPNYQYGDTGNVVPGVVVGHRNLNSVRRALVSAPIVAGASGGPVTDMNGIVVGVAVTGADSMEKVLDTEKHGVIPIRELALILPKPAPGLNLRDGDKQPLL